MWHPHTDLRAWGTSGGSGQLPLLGRSLTEGRLLPVSMDDLLDLGDGPNPAYASAPAVSGVAGGLNFGTSAAVAGQGGGSGDVGAAGGEEDDSLLQALEATALQATTPSSDPNSIYRNKSGTIGSLESLMLASDQIKALALPPPPPPPPPSMGTLGSTT